MVRLKTFTRNTEYAVLEDTFARRTFDESDYTLVNPDFDVRESACRNNRGIYTSGATRRCI